MLYIMSLVIGMIALIPAIVVYSINTSVTISDFFVLFVALLLTPIIPIIIALTIGILIVAVSSKSKHNNILALFLSIIGILLFVYVSSKLQTMDTSQIADISTMLTNYFNQFYPPAFLFSKALLNNDWISLGIFVLSSFLILLAFVAVVSYKSFFTSCRQKFPFRRINCIFSVHGTIQERTSPFFLMYDLCFKFMYRYYFAFGYFNYVCILFARCNNGATRSAGDYECI